MSAIREAVYECTYASPHGRFTGHVRAWDAREAVELFARELRDEGVRERGSISVRAPGERRVRRTRYPGPAQ